MLTSDGRKSKNILQDPPSETKELHEVKEAASSSKEKDDKKKDDKEAKEPPKEKVEKKGSKDDEKEKKEPEPNFEMVEILQNPARVLRQQLKVIQLLEGSAYVPVKDIQIGGIVMLKHLQTDAEEELVKPVAGKRA